MRILSIITVFLCLVFTMKASASEEEMKAIKKALSDIAHFDITRQQLLELKHKQTGKDTAPYKKTYQEKCVENALKLALRNPDSELSRAVCANIIEESISNEQIDLMFQRLQNAVKMNLTDEQTLCRKRLDELEDSRDKLSKKLWQDDLSPIISKILLANSDSEIYIPSSVKKDDSVGYNKGYELYDDSEGPLSFKGFEIGALTNTCDIILCQEHGNNIICKLKGDLFGLKVCTVSYDSLGRINGLHFMYYPDTKSEYDKILDNIVGEVRAMVEYKNKTFLCSNSLSNTSKGAMFAIDVYKSHRRYTIRIDQSHKVYENRMLHFVALRILFNNDIPLEIKPPKDGIHFGTPEVVTGVATDGKWQTSHSSTTNKCQIDSVSRCVKNSDLKYYEGIMSSFVTGNVILWLDSPLYKKIAKLKEGTCCVVTTETWSHDRSVLTYDCGNKHCELMSSKGLISEVSLDDFKHYCSHPSLVAFSGKTYLNIPKARVVNNQKCCIGELLAGDLFDITASIVGRVPSRQVHVLFSSQDNFEVSLGNRVLAYYVHDDTIREAIRKKLKGKMLRDWENRHNALVAQLPRKPPVVYGRCKTVVKRMDGTFEIPRERPPDIEIKTRYQTIYEDCYGVSEFGERFRVSVPVGEREYSWTKNLTHMYDYDELKAKMDEYYEQLEELKNDTPPDVDDYEVDQLMSNGILVISK